MEHLPSPIAYICLCAVLTANAADIAWAAEESDFDSLAKAYVSQVRDAADEYELHKTNDELLRDAAPQLLEQLTMQENDTAALLAKWAAVRNSIGAPVMDGPRWVPVDIDRALLARFLGFLEGRLRTAPPLWWRERMLGLQSENRFAMRVSADLPPAPDYSEHPNEEGRYRWGKRVRMSVGPDIANAKAAGSAVILNVDGQEISLGKRLLDDVEERTANRADAVNAVRVSGARYVVALHSDSCRRFPLYLIDVESNDQIWCAEVWAERPVVPGGQGFGLGHWVDFRVDRGAVYVFGAGWNSMYVEGFSLEDGRSLFRFSTSY